MIDIKNLSKAELGRELERLGEKPYRATQIFRWLYKEGASSFDEMTDLSQDLRRKLSENFHITRLEILDSKRSKIDGTTKYLFKLEDGNTIETVFLPERSRATVCLSTQVGCKFGCSFCASAPYGFIRDLKASEIMDELLWVIKENPSVRITNLVFMGIGEPFDNYDNVMRSIRIFNDKDGFHIGARKMTVSTCGLIPAIERFANEGLQVELSVSLHSADDGIRTKLVPVNKKYPASDLIKACKAYTEKTNRVVTFEYVLLKGVNSSEDDALKLARLLRGMKCKVNLISYNRITAEDRDLPSEVDINTFLDVLEKNNISATCRRSKGDDIAAGCGQLRIYRL